MMMVLFFALAAIAVAGAVSLIIQKEPIHSALSLIIVMVALAGLYLLLGAEFISAVQIIVYAGAIMVLFVFVIMLLNAGNEERTNFSRMAAYIGLPLAVRAWRRIGLFRRARLAERREYRSSDRRHASARNDAFQRLCFSV